MTHDNYGDAHQAGLTGRNVSGAYSTVKTPYLLNSFGLIRLEDRRGCRAAVAGAW